MDQETEDRTRRSDADRAPLYRAGLRFVFYYFAGLFVLNANPFGFDDLTERYSQDVVQFVAAPFYESTAPDHLRGGPVDGADPTLPARGRSAVAVVLLDETTLEALSLKWPVGYQVHGRTLRAILRACPRALFVDFRFIRGDEAVEIAALERHLFAFFGVQPAAGLDAASRLEQATETIAPAPGSGAAVCAERAANAGWALPDDHFHAGRYPLFFAVKDAPEEGLIGRLELFARPVPTRVGTDPDVYAIRQADRPEIDSAAFAMFKESGHPALAGRSKAGIAHAFDTALYPRWGFWIDPRQVLYRNTANCAQPDVRAPLTQALHMAALGVSGGDARSEGVISPCPPTLQIPAQMLWPGGVPAAEIQVDLQNRLVFYGGNLSATPDIKSSPVQGAVAGVFVHAMALDNLLTYGADYFRTREGWAGFAEAALWLLFVLVAVLRQKRREEEFIAEQTSVSAYDRDRFFSFVTSAAVGALAVTAVVVFCFATHTRPADFIALLGLGGALSLVESIGVAYLVTQLLRGAQRTGRTIKGRVRRMRDAL